MKVRAAALAAPLVLGAACMHTSTQSSAGTATAGQPAAQQPQAAAGEVTQDPLFQTGPRVQGHAGDEVVAGRITDVTNDSVSVQTLQGETRTLVIVPETEVQLDGRDASTDDLAQGQPVSASFDLIDGQQVAVKVHAGATNQGSSSTEQGSLGTGSPGTPSPDPESPSGGGGPAGEPHW